MGSRILLADDSITIQKVVNLTFAEEGIEVVAVSSGDLAEKRLSDVKPDLVLADIFMPGKNGYELCEAIKQNPQFRNVPVVLLVGAFEPFDQTEARRVRADAHLTKPFESRTLIETVRRLISANPRATTGPIAPATLPDDVREHARTTGPMTSATSASLRSTTDELASNPAFALQATGNEGTGEQTTDPDAKAVLTDTSERFEPMELSSDFVPLAGESVSNPALDSSEMVLDFDKSDVFGAPASDSAVSFDSQEGALLEAEVMPGGGDWSGRDNGSAAGFEMTSESAWQPGAPTTDVESERSPGFNLTSVDVIPSAETMSSPLLASDDPLGDVLLDDSGASVDSAPTVDVFSNEGLDVELAGPETEQAGDDTTLVSQASQMAPEAATPPVEVAPTVDKPALPADASERRDGAANPTGDLDWTSPRARSFSTAQLDSVVMSIEAREQINEVSARDNGHAPGSEETGFAHSAMAAEEEAHFTPIDIEAVDVTHPMSDRATDSETGFSFSSVIEEEPADRTDEAPATPTAVAYDNRPAELSTAAIEEIVRRVIAQMSESVVREVAWEVVPDCVERVINQLTRESVSRRA